MAVAEAKLLDAQGGMEYLVGAGGCGIVNADAYIAGEVTDFSEVGVKALICRCLLSMNGAFFYAL